MNNNLEFENEDPSPDSIEDNHPRTNYGEGYGGKETLKEAAEKYGNSIGNKNGTAQFDFIQGAKWQIGKQDNFIIGFLEFIEGTYSYSNIFDYWYLHADTSKTYTKKELLKKYNDTLNGN